MTKNITNLINEVTYACSNDQKPDHDPDLQNLGDNIACELLGLNIAWWIKQCNSGNEFACEYCYDKQYNRGCYEVKSVWEEADSVTYRLTANGDPGEPDNEPTIEVNCDMTNLASAAISGCGYGASPPHVSRDCEAGHDNDYNRSCVQVKKEWGAAPSGNFELTYNGADSPVTVYCNTSTVASAAITGCGYNTDTEGPIPPDEYVPGDCAYARTENYNLTCDDIFNFWSERPEGHYYNLTAGGDVPPNLVSSRCQPYTDPPDPTNICGNTEATTNFLSTETGFDYSFRMINCNIANNPVENHLCPCTGGTCGDNDPGCWFGKTGSPCTHSGCGGDLGGNKTDKYLCNYPGAVAACHALNGANPAQYGEGCSDGKCTKNSTGWRLPTIDEAARLRIDPSTESNLIPKAINNLLLCDGIIGGVGYGPQHRCGEYGGCQGTVDNKCYPFGMWVSKDSPQDPHYYYYQAKWRTVDSYHPPTYALSVRCARSLL